MRISLAVFLGFLLLVSCGQQETPTSEDAMLGISNPQQKTEAGDSLSSPTITAQGGCRLGICGVIQNAHYSNSYLQVTYNLGAPASNSRWLAPGQSSSDMALTGVNDYDADGFYLPANCQATVYLYGEGWTYGYNSPQWVKLSNNFLPYTVNLQCR